MPSFVCVHGIDGEPRHSIQLARNVLPEQASFTKRRFRGKRSSSARRRKKNNYPPVVRTDHHPQTTALFLLLEL